MWLVLPSVQEGQQGTARPPPLQAPLPLRCCPSYPRGQSRQYLTHRVAAGHSVCADTEWKWEFGHNRRPLGEFCSPARIQGSWTGLSALGSSTGPANRSKLGRSPGSAQDAGRLGMDFTG